MRRFWIKGILFGLVIGCVACAALGEPKAVSANMFGAKGDGVTLNTVSIQQTIDHVAKHGGGTVIFAPGVYLTGAIFVKNHVALRVDEGVTLLGSQRLADYPVMPTRVAGVEMSWPAALVNIYQQNDASIAGEGTIDGDGKIYWESYWTLRKSYEPRGLRWAADYDAQRPRLIQIFEAKHVRIGDGIHLRRSGFWTVDICYSSHVTVDGVTIRNNEGGRGPSTDGIDIDSSKHILVQHADISVNDDALCLKAGRDADGLRVNRPTEDVVLRDSIVRDGAAVMTIGSETSGGFRNIKAYNLTGLSHVGVGILFKSAHTRGGWGEHIRIRGITLVDVPVVFRVTMNWNPSYSYAQIPAGMSGYPAYWKVLATPVSEERGRARFHDVRVSEVKATGAKVAFEVSAFPQVRLDDFRFSNIQIAATSAGYIHDASRWRFRDVLLETTDGSVVSVRDDSDVIGIATRQAAAVDTQKPSAKQKSFAEQDKDE